ncbi:MAG: hypothetical protein KF894_08760 [Labilithrix sp.]|nr:hypothetical protein [Labilithrix sp.]
MTRIAILSAVSLSLLALGACGSDGDEAKQGTGDARTPPANASNTPLTADERACEALYLAQIDWTHRCGGILNESAHAVARFRTLCARELAAPGAEPLRDARAKCAERRKSASCDEELPECELPAGTLADGAPCAARSQCQSRYCKLEGTCGTCAQPAAAGGACSSPVDCAFGAGEVASCDIRQGSSAGTCTLWKIAKVGETCGGTTLCDASGHCMAPEENATTGSCVPNDDVGAICDVTRDCKAGLACVAGKCAPRPKAGEACGQVDDCAGGLVCDGTCKGVSYVGAGEQCDAARRCERGRCVQKVTQGADGQLAAAGPPTCVEPLADGAPCGQEQSTNGFLCDEFARCLGGRCILADPAQCR